MLNYFNGNKLQLAKKSTTAKKKSQLILVNWGNEVLYGHLSLLDGTIVEVWIG